VTEAETRTYRWLPAGGRRHAVPGDRVKPGEEITTLVGERVTVPLQRLGSTEWTWPTCVGCWDEAKKCTHVSLAGLGVPLSVATETQPTASRPNKRKRA
jgi:hypothetical protein